MLQRTVPTTANSTQTINNNSQQRTNNTQPKNKKQKTKSERETERNRASSNTGNIVIKNLSFTTSKHLSAKYHSRVNSKENG